MGEHTFLLIILGALIGLSLAFALLGELGVVPKIGELFLINIRSITGDG